MDRENDHVEPIEAMELVEMPESRATALPRRPERAPAPGVVGSLDWCASVVYGGPSKFVGLVWALLAGEGQQADRRWQRLLNIYLGWCEQWEAQPEDGRGEPPTLNEAAQVCRVNLRELLDWVSTNVQATMAVMARQRMAFAALDLTDAAIEQGKMPEGFKDRQMILASLGAVQAAEGGVQVNVNQQVALVSKEGLRSPLLQFRETTEAIDSVVREGETE